MCTSVLCMTAATFSLVLCLRPCAHTTTQLLNATPAPCAYHHSHSATPIRPNARERRMLYGRHLPGTPNTGGRAPGRAAGRKTQSFHIRIAEAFHTPTAGTLSTGPAPEKRGFTKPPKNRAVSGTEAKEGARGRGRKGDSARDNVRQGPGLGQWQGQQQGSRAEYGEVPVTEAEAARDARAVAE